MVLQQLVDQSKLPTLFMRTVIQCVNQYPGLVNFVTNILLKLINKKVWTSPKLWEGFIRCCTVSASDLVSRNLEWGLHMVADDIALTLNTRLDIGWRQRRESIICMSWNTIAKSTPAQKPS